MSNDNSLWMNNLGGLFQRDLALSEIFKVISNLNFNGSYKNIIKQITCFIPKILIIYLVKHYISDTIPVINFMKKCSWWIL